MAGNKPWLPYHELSHLRALANYFEVIGVTRIEHLRRTGDEDLLDDDLQTSGVFRALGATFIWSLFKLPIPSTKLKISSLPSNLPSRSLLLNFPTTRHSAPHPHHPAPRKAPKPQCRNHQHHQCEPVERYIDCINCRWIYFDLHTYISQQPSQMLGRHTIIDPSHSCGNHLPRNEGRHQENEEDNPL